MNHHTRVRESVFAAAAALLLATALEGQAQSPSTIGGRTIQLTISGGSFPFASSGQYRFLPSAVDSGYAIVPISGNVDPSTGTHTYTKTGANTARLSLVDSGVGGLTATCTFSTATSGTYTLKSTAFPGPSQSGTFVLYAGSSPASIAGTTVTVTITSGEFPFATWGSYRFLPAASGSTFSVVALSGTVGNSSGTYSYSKNSEYTGIISFTDSILGSGFASQLSFDSPTTGTLFLRKSGSTGYQTGFFTMTTPSVPPLISVHPVSQTVNVGASVTFSVSASGTPPLAYQWRKNGINIAGANAASYTISSAQPADQGVFDVTVSNSGGFVTSSAANLTVVSPPGIVTHPASLAVRVGTSAAFAVVASGSAPLSYQWRKNQIDIPGATLASFTIGNVQSSDAGAYSVRVSNAAGSVTSNPATLQVSLVATERPSFAGPQWSAVTGFSTTLQGKSQTAYRIQWSTNLVTWLDFTNFVTTGVSSQIIDQNAGTGRIRFYRAVSP
jgi:hypothetical protein